MLKIGFNVTSRITPLEPDTKESPVQQQAEEQTVVQPKSTFANSGPMRSEAMMSSIALRTQLNQQLATQTLEGNHDVVHSESLQHLEQIDRQAPLTQQEAEEQISNQPKYVNPFKDRRVQDTTKYSMKTALEDFEKKKQEEIEKKMEEFDNQRNNNHDVVNSESLQHLEQIDRQAPLTQQEAEQQNSLQRPYAYSLMQTLFEAFESVSTKRLYEKMGGMDETTRKIVSGLQVKVRVAKDED